jgi:hypothetical protein
MRSPRALTLLETVMAVFLLLGGAFTCLTVLRQAAGYGTQSRQLENAQWVAGRTLDAIRRWAYDPDNYFGSWDIYNDDEFSFPEYHDARVRTLCPGRQPMGTPSASLELPRGLQARLMQEAYMPVRVSVIWGRNQTLRLVAHIAQPQQTVRNSNPVELSRGAGPPDPIPPYSEVEWSAALLASDGRPIPGSSFSWQVVPYDQGGDPGNGWFLEQRGSLGRRGKLQHRFYNVDPILNLPPFYEPGSLTLRAETLYQGRPYSAESGPVVLGP